MIYNELDYNSRKIQDFEKSFVLFIHIYLLAAMGWPRVKPFY